MTPHKKYLKLCSACVGLDNKDILEVGGCTPLDFLTSFKPKSWTCINLNNSAVNQFNEYVSQMGLENFTAVSEDIARIDFKKKYDIIYSINCFEHIADLSNAFAKMYESLKDGGYLFSLFGPIWSSDVGHHLSVATKSGGLHFLDGTIEPWEHLLSSKKLLLEKLTKKFDQETAFKVVDYIYVYPDINRLFELDYFNIIKNSDFQTVSIIKNKKGRAPSVPGATSTRDLVLILKKGKPCLVEKIITPIIFASTYLKHQLAGKLRATN